MNVELAWEQDIIGRGVVVSILDDGLEHTHPDLRDNYVSAWSNHIPRILPAYLEEPDVSNYTSYVDQEDHKTRLSVWKHIAGDSALHKTHLYEAVISKVSSFSSSTRFLVPILMNLNRP